MPSAELLQRVLRSENAEFLQVSVHSIEAEWALKQVALDPYRPPIELSEEERIHSDETLVTMLEVARHNLPLYGVSQARKVLHLLGGFCVKGQMTDDVFLEFAYEVDESLERRHGQLAIFGFNEIPEAFRKDSEYRRDLIAQARLLPTQPLLLK